MMGAMKKSLIFISLISIIACSNSDPEKLGTLSQSLCEENSQCDDNDICTTDTCDVSECVYSSSGLCEEDESNCGAESYSCLNGRECLEGRCTPAWQPIEDDGAPAGRYAAAAAEFEGRYVITGGCVTSTDVATSDASAYDPSTDTWTTLAPLTYGRAFHTAVTIETGTSVYGGLAYCNDTSTVGLDFEKLADLEDSSWSEIARNWTAGYNNTSVKADVDDVVMLGGGETTTSVLEQREGSPAWYGSWGEWYCTQESCGRQNFIAFFDHDIEDRPIVKVMGGDPTYGIPDLYSPIFDVWSHTWSYPESTLDYPSHSAITHSTSTPIRTSIPVGPRLADDGMRVYILSTSGSVHIYDKAASSWTEESETPPSGFCPEAAVAWVGGELIAYSGICGENVSTVGGRYQPPAP